MYPRHLTLDRPSTYPRQPLELDPRQPLDPLDARAQEQITVVNQLRTVKIEIC